MGWIIGRKLYESRKGVFFFWCPGCDCVHAVYTNGLYTVDGVIHNWTFNGDADKPTFRPSLNVSPKNPERQCHSWVTDGQITFLGDCHHDLKNKTVEIPDWESD